MRIFTLIAILMLATVACNLGTLDNPTAQPTRTSAAATLRVNETLTAAASAPVATTSVALQPTPGCAPRTDWPTTTVGTGESLLTIAQRVGVDVTDIVIGNCLANGTPISVGQILYIPPKGNTGSAGAAPTAIINVVPTPNNCGTASWFFVFRPGKGDTLCPGQTTAATAIGQNFEGGRAYLYQTGSGGTIYVIFNDGTWQTYPNTWDASQPADDPSIVAPPDFFKPTGALGKLWRDQLRNRLGWAYQPESSFNGQIQSPVNDNSYFYIAHGLRNLALRLYRSSEGSGRWEVVGTY